MRSIAARTSSESAGNSSSRQRISDGSRPSRRTRAGLGLVRVQPPSAPRTTRALPMTAASAASCSSRRLSSSRERMRSLVRCRVARESPTSVSTTMKAWTTTARVATPTMAAGARTVMATARTDSTAPAVAVARTPSLEPNQTGTRMPTNSRGRPAVAARNSTTSSRTAAPPAASSSVGRGAGSRGAGSPGACRARRARAVTRTTNVLLALRTRTSPSTGRGSSPRATAPMRAVPEALTSEAATEAARTRATSPGARRPSSGTRRCSTSRPTSAWAAFAAPKASDIQGGASVAMLTPAVVTTTSPAARAVSPREREAVSHHTETPAAGQARASCSPAGRVSRPSHSASTRRTAKPTTRAVA